MASGLDLHPDARVLTFTAALCLLTTVLFGLAPALRTSKVTLVAGMKGDAKHARFGLRKLLVVSQVALSLALLIGAALFVRTLRNLKSQDLAMALHYFGRLDVVGAHFGMRRDRGDEIEIVGVAKDAKYNTLRESNVSMIYIPYRQDLAHLYDMCLAVHTTSYSPGLTGRIRDELRSIDPRLPILSIDSIQRDIDKTLTIERLIAWVASFFGGLAVLLACIGLYGVMSYVAARKTNEIGIRFALGATRVQVLRSVLKEGMLLVPAGIAIGAPATLAATRLITSLLFGVKPADLMAIGLATTLMIAVAGVGSFLPARRASNVDSMVVLRYE